MHFQLDEAAAAFRAQLRAHLNEAMTPDLAERVYRSGDAHDDDFAAGLVENGLFAPGWPAEFGGGDRRAIEVQLLTDEMQRADAPVYLSETTRMVASVIRRAGS